MKITKDKIIILLFIIGVLSLISTFILYQLAQEVCLKSEQDYYRKDYAGLFGVEVKVRTNEANADGVTNFCIEYYQPKFFQLNKNIIISTQYFSNNSQSQIIEEDKREVQDNGNRTRF